MTASLPVFGMFTTDTRLVVRTWDRFLEAITAIGAEQALNRAIGDVLPELERGGVLSILRHVAANGTIEVLAPALHQPLIICPPSDPSTTSRRMQQRVTVGPIREEGRITGVAVTIEDVTVRVERDRNRTERLSSSAVPNPNVPDSASSLVHTLGDENWRARRAARRGLAEHGSAIVETLVKTLREQYRNFNVLSSLLDLLVTADIDVVEPLVACLKDQDAELRIQAALILGERRDRRALPALARALDDGDVNVQFHAIEALGSLGASEAVPALLNIASRGDFFLAFPAIQALSRIGDASVAPRLVPLLKDELLCATVAEALGALGDELVVVPLVQLLNEPNAPTDVVADALAGLFDRYEDRYGAGEHIASLARRGLSAAGTQNLLDAVHRVGSDRLRGIASVLGWLSGPAVQRALTRLLGQRLVRAQVVEALVRYGAGVVDLLIEQLTAEDLDTRQAAAVALGRIGDRRATRALLHVLHDPELALPVAGALARLGDAGAFGPLLGLLGHVDTAVRQAAIAALNSIGHPDMPARIVRLLDDPNPTVRESAVKIAGYFGYRECVNGVLERCADASEAVRRAAVEHLPFFEDGGVIPALAHALAFDTPAVRAAAAAAFARVEEADALAPLLRALDDEDPWVRYFAVRSMGAFANPVVTGPVLRLVERDPAGQVRLAAIDVLGRLNAAGAVAILESLSASSDADIARAAIRGLGHAKDEKAKRRLESLLRSDEPWRRTEAVAALGERADADAASTLQWVAAAETDPAVADAAISALALLGSREDVDAIAATGALISLTAEHARREASIAALCVLPTRRIGDIAKGLQQLSPDVRRATIAVLGRMKHTEATRWIESALEDPVAAVRAAAVAELRRLGTRHAAKKLLTLARTDPDRDVRQAAVTAVTQRADLTAGDQLEVR
jgi:HEAT repeat protein